MLIRLAIAGLLLFPAAALAAIGGVVPVSAPPSMFPTPPMGWNSFYDAGSDNETDVHARVNSLISTGLFTAGWKLIDLDEGWATGSRNGITGEPQANGGFPSGMPNLATFIHANGMLAGLYSDAGPAPGCGPLGSWTFFPNDFDWFFNRWRYDYVKMDTGGWRTPPCSLTDYNSPLYPYTVIPTMAADALSTARLPYAIEGPTDSANGNISWALTPLYPNLVSWYVETDGRGYGRTINVMNYVLRHPGQTQKYHYPHPDMLEAGPGSSLSFEQQVANFEMYCILTAQLMLGADPATFSAPLLAVLSNPEIIAISQDTATLPAFQVGGQADVLNNGIAIYKYLAAPNTRAVFLFNVGNFGQTPVTVSFTNTDIGMSGTFNIRDVRTQTNIATGVTSFSNSIGPGEGQLLKITAGTDVTLPVAYKVATGSASPISPFSAASNQNDGIFQSVGTTIDLTACSPHCAPQGVYQSARVGQPLLIANGNLWCGGSGMCNGGPAIDTNFIVQPGTYTVRLHFCENWKSGAGQRKFNVQINNVIVLVDEDVFADAGAANKAIYKDFTVTTTRPLISVTAYPGTVDQAMISGIEIL